MSRKSRRLDRLARLSRSIDRHEADLKRKMKNEDVVRLEKNGEISYERIRTVAVPRDDADELRKSDFAAPAKAAGRSAAADASDVTPEPATASNSLPNNLPETPVIQDFGTLFGPASAERSTAVDASAAPEMPAANDVASDEHRAGTEPDEAEQARINCHEAGNSCHKQPDAAKQPESNSSAPPSDPPEIDPLEELLCRAAAVASVRRGRPPAFDEVLKGQLVALLSVGLSMRQAAGLLGVSHTTVQNTLRSEPQLEDDIKAARFRAQLAPLACVIRESRRSWKAATWLLKYLDTKLATHEETPQEKRDRQARESDEFFARCDAAEAARRG
jgi:hypothetical protein